jgi:hypothetical protein
MSIPPTCAANLAVFGHCHPTLAAFNRTDWLTNNPRSAEDDQGTRQLQANAQTKRSGIAPGQIMGEPEQVRSRGHDQGAYSCVEADEKTDERGANSCWITSGGRETIFPTDNPMMMLPTYGATTLLGICQHHGEACGLPNKSNR